jgi:Xaa-Pro aminopeptidase
MGPTATEHASMDYVARVRRLLIALSSNRLDAMLITHLPNIRYLCGFTGSSAVLLVAECGSTLFTDGRYRTQARQEVKGSRIVIVSKSPLIAAAEWLLSRSLTPSPRSPKSTSSNSRSSNSKSANSNSSLIGIESETLAAALRDRLAAELKGKFRLRSPSRLIERARMVKQPAEIDCIRRAAALGASLFAVAKAKICPGVTEAEVAAAMEYEARRAGADGMSFPTILASGPRSALIHGRASLAQIPANGFVVCDFGVILAGYCSDRTRTVHVGKPSAEARHLYQSVLEAQQAAIEAVRPGATASEVDAAARKVLRRQKLGRYFTHSTGHGLGLEIHEAPRLAAGQTQELEPGMVVTVEPGAYIPGKWGVRIEDVVVVTPSGREVMTPTDKDLIII